MAADRANTTPRIPETTAPLARMNMLEPDHRARVTEITAPPRNSTLMAFGARPPASRTRASSRGTEEATARATMMDVWWETTK